MAKEIKLSKGYIALVDDIDFEWLNRQKWCAHARDGWVYARGTSKETRRKVAMHRVILAAPAGILVDHIDGDGLNNQRANLRLCTPAQNVMNIRAVRGPAGFKGVRKAPGCKTRPWFAMIRHQRKSEYLGAFHSPEEAAAAYDAAAIRLFGEFARTNAMLGLLPSGPGVGMGLPSGQTATAQLE